MLVFIIKWALIIGASIWVVKKVYPYAKKAYEFIKALFISKGF